MDANSVDEIIKGNVARARLREMINSISLKLYSQFRTSRRVKMEEVLSVLREYGSYINTADSYGETSVHVACRLKDCDMDILQELLKHGGQVDILNGSGESALHLVARDPQKLNMMKELLKYSRNPNVTNIRGETPLYVAIRSSEHDLDMVYELLEHGADFRIADDKSRNSLHAAVKNPCCSIDLIKKFLQEAPTFVNCQDSTNSTPLHGAVRYCNNLEIVKELLDCGADPKIKNKRGKSPLHIAVQKPHADIVELLLKHGADVNDLDSSHLTPLHYSLNMDKPDISVIKVLMKYGADINAVTQYGMNVIYVAVCNPTTSYEIVKLFLENGAQPAFNEKCNILVNIKESRRYDIAHLLIPYIILRNINATYPGKTSNLDLSYLTPCLAQFQEVLVTSIAEDSDNYHNFLQVCSMCIVELLEMTCDFICKDLTLFQFVSDNCSRTTPHEQNVPLQAIDEVLLRLKNDGDYENCRELIYMAVKRSVLVNRVCELEICYKIPDGGTVTLNSLCINNIAKYLSKEDVLHMIMAFSDKFKDIESIDTIASKRSAEGGRRVRKKRRA